MNKTTESPAVSGVGSTDLLACPFCGHHANIEQPVHAEAWGRWVTPVRCSSSHCRAELKLPSDYPDVEMRLTVMWNRRANAEVSRAHDKA
jgi:hypothetical protein